jgi:hypothetical protein
VEDRVARAAITNSDSIMSSSLYVIVTFVQDLGGIRPIFPYTSFPSLSNEAAASKGVDLAAVPPPPPFFPFDGHSHARKEASITRSSGRS